MKDTDRRTEREIVADLSRGQNHGRLTCRGSQVERRRGWSSSEQANGDAQHLIGRRGPRVEAEKLSTDRPGGEGDQAVVDGAARYPSSRKCGNEVVALQPRLGDRRERTLEESSRVDGGNPHARQAREDGQGLNERMSGDRRRAIVDECPGEGMVCMAGEQRWDRNTRVDYCIHGVSLMSASTA